MSLSDKLNKRIDLELHEINIHVLGGGLTIENYKYTTGKYAGLMLAKNFLKDVLKSAQKDEDFID